MNHRNYIVEVLFRADGQIYGCEEYVLTLPEGCADEAVEKAMEQAESSGYADPRIDYAMLANLVDELDVDDDRSVMDDDDESDPEEDEEFGDDWNDEEDL